MNAAAPTTAQKEMEPYGTGRDRCYYDWEIHIPLGVRVAARGWLLLLLLPPPLQLALMPLAATCHGMTTDLAVKNKRPRASFWISGCTAAYYGDQQQLDLSAARTYRRGRNYL